MAIPWQTRPAAGARPWQTSRHAAWFDGRRTHHRGRRRRAAHPRDRRLRPAARGLRRRRASRRPRRPGTPSSTAASRPRRPRHPDARHGRPRALPAPAREVPGAPDRLRHVQGRRARPRPRARARRGRLSLQAVLAARARGARARAAPAPGAARVARRATRRTTRRSSAAAPLVLDLQRYSASWNGARGAADRHRVPPAEGARRPSRPRQDAAAAHGGGLRRGRVRQRAHDRQPHQEAAQEVPRPHARLRRHPDRPRPRATGIANPATRTTATREAHYRHPPPPSRVQPPSRLPAALRLPLPRRL